MWLGKVEVVRTYDRDIRSVTFKIRMPAVVRLLRFIRRKRPQISFSRRNLFARDANSCQYCGAKRESSELTYDHVVPRSLGGKTDWAQHRHLLHRLQPPQGGPHAGAGGHAPHAPAAAPRAAAGRAHHHHRAHQRARRVARLPVLERPAR